MYAKKQACMACTQVHNTWTRLWSPLTGLWYSPLVVASTLASAHMLCVMSHVTSVNIRHSSHTLVPHIVYSYLATGFTLKICSINNVGEISSSSLCKREKEKLLVSKTRKTISLPLKHGVQISSITNCSFKH
jgi:hypothetical protein